MIEIETAQKIHQAMVELTTEAGEWIGLGAVREVSGVSREAFDRTMIEMFKLGILVIAPEDNQKMITSADRYNSVTVAGEERHLVALA